MKYKSIRLHALAAFSLLLFAGESFAAEKTKPINKPAATSHHEAVKLESLPAPVRDTIVAQAHGGKVSGVEKLTKDKDGSVSYVAQITGKDGKAHRIAVDSAGKVIATKPKAHT